MRVLAVLIVLMSAASAYEIKLNEAWIPKLQTLCEGARFSIRMMAEPICQELQGLIQAAMAEEEAAKAKIEQPKKGKPKDGAKPNVD